MCPCDCHAEQAEAVEANRLALQSPVAAERVEPEWSGLKGTDSPNYSGPVEAAVEQFHAELEAARAAGFSV